MHSTVGEFRMMKVCVVEVMAGSSNDHTEIDEPPPSIYFGGCGFGCAFFIGAHRAMVERWGVDFHKRTIIAGGSAGAVMAIQVALGRTNDQMHEMYRWTASEALQRGPIQQASACLMEAVTKILESESSNAYKSLSQNNCFISATNFPFEHKFYSRWLDNDDLVACIAASCHIPLYSQRGSGSYADHVDGAYGFSGTALAAELHGNDTLFVGIDPTADVGRSLTQMQMLYPLVGEEYDAVVESGYQAMMSWHRSRKVDKVGQRVPNRQVLLVLWFLRGIVNVLDMLLWLWCSFQPSLLIKPKVV